MPFKPKYLAPSFCLPNALTIQTVQTMFSVADVITQAAILTNEEQIASEIHGMN
jgi:hypothetical protein